MLVGNGEFIDRVWGAGQGCTGGVLYGGGGDGSMGGVDQHTQHGAGAGMNGCMGCAYGGAAQCAVQCTVNAVQIAV